MLDPDNRSLLTNLLTPPPGMVFDHGLATTYTLDLVTLLSVPLYLTWLANGEDKLLETDAIRLLEGLQRVSNALTIYSDRGHIHVPARPNALYSLLGSCVTEVRAPNGGAFHPKIWLLRFKDENDDANVLLRLGILSRNLTADASWDLALQVEGRPTGRNVAANLELFELIRSLPDWVVGKQEKRRAKQTQQLADEMRRTRFEPPTPWGDIGFHVMGRSKAGWLPPVSDEMVVISPFLSATALQKLSATSTNPLLLISRPDQLMELDEEDRLLFSGCMILDEAAESEDGEDSVNHLIGLHAKAILTRQGRQVSLYVGSANATNAALVNGHNIEVLARLTGDSGKVGRPGGLVDSSDFGRLLTPFVPSSATLNTAVLNAEKRLDQLQRLLSDTVFVMECVSEGDDWVLLLKAIDGKALSIPDDVEIAGWPLSLNSDQKKDLGPLRSGLQVRFGVVAIADITGFVGIDLHLDGVTRKFALNLPVLGSPDGREGAILGRVIRNQDGFLRYLKLMLGEFTPLGGGEDLKACGLENPNGGPANLLGIFSVLEDMVRVYAREPKRLHEVRRVIKQLRQSCDRVVPEGFLQVWQVFEEALKDEK